MGPGPRSSARSTSRAWPARARRAAPPARARSGWARTTGRALLVIGASAGTISSKPLVRALRSGWQLEAERRYMNQHLTLVVGRVAEHLGRTPRYGGGECVGEARCASAPSPSRSATAMRAARKRARAGVRRRGFSAAVLAISTMASSWATASRSWETILEGDRVGMSRSRGGGDVIAASVLLLLQTSSRRRGHQHDAVLRVIEPHHAAG